MSKQFLVFNPQGDEMGVYAADDAEGAIEACVRDAGYESVKQMEATLGRDCELVARDVTEAAQWLGQRVEAGVGEDYDTGEVVDVIDEQTVLVAWDSCVSTPADLSQLTAL